MAIDETGGPDCVSDKIPRRTRTTRGHPLDDASRYCDQSANHFESRPSRQSACPTLQRAPAATRFIADNIKRADVLPHPSGRHATAPLAQRLEDGAESISKLRRNPSGHHRDHHAARRAQVASHRDLTDFWLALMLPRPQLQSLPNPVPDHSKTFPHSSARSAASTARRRPHRLDGGHLFLPALDVDARHDDALIAPLLIQGGRSTTGGVLVHLPRHFLQASLSPLLPSNKQSYRDLRIKQNSSAMGTAFLPSPFASVSLHGSRPRSIRHQGR
jgi:hypothetical protein